MNEKRTEPFQAYLSRIEELIDETPVQDTARKNDERLPLLDEALLSRLAQYAEEVSQDHPDQGWIIAKLIDTAASTQSCGLLIKAKAAWYLARAANHCAQPKWVLEAVSRAREGFAAFNETGWLAACDWQENALPWTKTNVAQAMNILKSALQELQEAGFEEFVPECRLSLANAQTLMGEFKDAKENIAISEAYYAAQGDEINQARCWLLEVGLLRRQSQYDRSLQKLENALAVFEYTHSPLDIAKTQYQLALIHLLRTDNLTVARNYFEQAIDTFEHTGVDLWQAVCKTNLGYIYMQLGDFQKADNYYQQARESFRRHDVSGLLADNLNDSGKLSLLRGSPNIAVEQFTQAVKIYEKQEKRKLPYAISEANLGEAYGRIGRYQDALYHLERASQELESFNNYLRLGTCERFTALIWIQLGRLDTAHEHLNKAIDYYKKVNHEAYFTVIYNAQADIYFQQDESQKAIESLKKSLETAKLHEIQPQISLSKRLLGEGYLKIQQIENAEEYLNAALTESIGLGMLTEEAAALVALGNYYVHTAELEKAKDSFERAIALSDNVLPEVAWRGFAGVAELAKTQNQISAAMKAYHQGIDVLTQIRRNFWQPSLIGAYLQKPASFFDAAVSLAAKCDTPVDALTFVESGKTTTLFQQIHSNDVNSEKISQEIKDLRAEIDWLQEKLSVSHTDANPLRSAVQSRRLRKRLIELTQKYDTVVAKQERLSFARSTAKQFQNKFDLDSFKALAHQVLGENWLALDYYLTKNQLVLLIISPTICQIYTSDIPSRVRMSLESYNNGQNVESLLTKDLEILGDWLIPDCIAENLTLDTVILLAPHRELHGIPWAGLRPGFSSESLVFSCVLNIIPSLQSLSFLWRRSLLDSSQSRDQGLVVGVSSFGGLKDDLPSVKEETTALREAMPNSKFLLEKEATWENLISLHSQGKKNGLSDFSWLHIASHAYADIHSGRLSRVALWNSDMRLDQLRDLGPLPSLVTYSACNSIYSFIYEGDEHVGLFTTSFIAGANTVVGSIWPVSDHAAAKFTTFFYTMYRNGLSPAQVVALTQREMARNGEKVSDWAGFTCMGIP